MTITDRGVTGNRTAYICAKNEAIVNETWYNQLKHLNKTHINPFTTQPQAIFLLLQNDNLGIIN